MADTLPADLSKVDPADAWKPYTPSDGVPWNRKWVTHLYRRAAFGASPAEVEQALKDGPAKTLDCLMTGSPDAAELLEFYTDTGGYFTDITQLRVWWLSVMLESGHPLREKLTLFWHNHFATSQAKVRSTRQMFEQNVVLRRHALGKFRPFLLEMSKDPAMLVWLDSNQNVKGAPNENYAREVMELFSLGVGNYTEKDIQEAARAFTGWHVEAIPNHDDYRFEFKPDKHDDGPKTVFGKTGNWNGEDVVKFCCDHDACAKFLVGKLYAFLVNETPPPKGLLTPLEARFRKSDYDIADLVRTMLASRLFFSDHAYRKRVKWPVEYALGTVRAVVPDRAPLADLLDPLAKMGQVLFAPPNVKGWRTGTDWLNSATLLARNNYAESVAMGNWARLSVAGRNRNQQFGATKSAPVPATPLVEYPADASAAAAGSPSAVTFPTLDNPDGMKFILPVPAAPGEGGAAGGAQPPGVIGPATNQTPNPDTKLDVIHVLYATKPKTANELVSRMSDLLYGTDVTPAARGKVQKYLLGGLKEITAKELESKDFRQKSRESLHALMCLPEYQLG
jgi:hypothetical protein